MKRYIDILLLLLLFLWTGCNTDEPAQKIKLPVSICIPANEIHPNAAPAHRRAMGDPGTKEEFLFPNHLYFIVVKQNNDETWSVWEMQKQTLQNEDWILTRYNSFLPTYQDSIYRFDKEIDLLLSAGDKFDGRVYAIASAVELTFNRTFDKSNITNLEQTLTLTFNTASIQDNLQNIYTTPEALLYNGEYYGSFSSKFQRVPVVNLLLYHIAAKVDITWKTASSDLRLTKMKAKNLFNGNAYCFKPMENSSGAPLDAGAEITIIGSNAVGQWWEGRYYFYTIPYTTTGKTGYFPLQMEMETNDSGNNYRPTIYMKVNTTDPFVPWLRANFNIDIELPNGTDTKTIDY